MATFIENSLSPISSSQSHGALTEQLVKAKLSELPDEYTVILNLPITDHRARALSEADDVIITPTGTVVVLEVKYGDLKTDENGDLTRTYGSQEVNISSKLSRQYRLFLSRLTDRFPGQSIRLRHYLVLPNGKISTAGSFNDVRDRIIDSGRFRDLNRIIAQDNLWTVPTGSYPRAAELTEFFADSLRITQDISAMSSGMEQSEKDNTEGLCTWVPRIETSAPVIEIEAPAGAGKTRLAVTLLQRAVQNHERAIYLGFHRNNIERLRETALASKVNFIGTWHEFAREKTRDATDPSTLTYDQRSAWFEKISTKLCELLPHEEFGYDLIVVDDAEDFRLEWISAIANALSEKGHLYTMRDNCSTSKNQPPEFAPVDHILISTYETARVPAVRAEEMHLLALVPEKFATANPHEGEHTLITSVESTGDFAGKTKEAIENALAAGFKPEEICLLTASGFTRSKLLTKDRLGNFALKKPTRAFDANGDMIFSTGEIYTDTLRRFKGLHAPCVIVTEIDFPEITDDVISLFYSMMTRSSLRLELVILGKTLEALLARAKYKTA